SPISQNNTFSFPVQGSHLRDPGIRLRFAVSIGKEEIRIYGLLDPESKSIFFVGPESFIILDIDDLYSGISALEFLYDLQGFVCRGIIYDHHLELRMILRKDLRKKIIQVFGLILGANDH